MYKGSTQAHFNDSFKSSSNLLSTNLTDTRKDGIHPFHVQSSSLRQNLKDERRLDVSFAKEIRRRSTKAKHHVVSDKVPLETINSNVTFTVKAQRIPSDNVTHFSHSVTHFFNLTRSLNDFNKIGSALHTSRGNSSPEIQASIGERSKEGGKRRAKRGLKLSLNKPDRSKLPSHYERERTSDKAKTHFDSREKKRRKYSSTVISERHHRTRSKHHERSLRRFKRKTAVSDEDELKQERSVKRIRSLYHLPLRLGGERVLLRFKRKSIPGQGDEVAPSSDIKEHKEKQRPQTTHKKHIKPRSVFKGKSSTVSLNGIIKGDFLKETEWRAPSDTTNSYSKALVDRNVIPHATYDPVIYGAKSSSRSLNPARLSSIPKEYSAISNRRQSVSSINKALYPPASTLSNQAIALKSEPRTPQIASLWSTDFPQNAPVLKQLNIPHPVRYGYGAGQQQKNSLQNTEDQNKKQFIPASQRSPYGYGHQFNYQPRFIKSQMALAGGNPRIISFPKMGSIKPLPFSREGARMNPEWPVASPTVNFHNPLNFGNGFLQRSRVPEGLVLYLNFENVQNGRAAVASLKGDVTGTDKRTEITKFFGSCGKVARINNGSEILLDGKKLKMKPRQAVSIAAWIKLDSNKGYHSIFDTVGGHSMHQKGQYHFEIQDGSLRWFHRNETGVTIFSVETDPIIPANVWNHVVGTYDARTGIAKIFVNGRLKAEAAGKGLLSQDWDAHAGIGKHKNQRFLQGEVDEFRIYNKALPQSEIVKLMKVCSFERVCGGLFNSPKGILESPEWPKSYKGKTSCTWHLSVDPSEKITLSFKRFSLDEDGTCKKAKLVVRDGSRENSEALGVYCGTKWPSGITSSGNHLLVQFTSTAGGKGKGFLISYNTETFHQTKKTERPPTPTQADDSQRCAVTRPEYNVTLIGGIKSGIFSEAKHVHDMDLCTRHCCLRKSCDLAFMIRDSCYLVKCTSQSLCKTKPARPSSMNPRITFVSHLRSMTPEPELSVDGSAYNKAITSSISKPTTLPAKEQRVCHHTAVSYNVTLVGGINAGKFSTYGGARNIDECIGHCCREDKCDVAFMIQGNCYAVECTDAEGCQVKRAKPSAYNPTVAYVYRGNERPIGDPLPGAEKPSPDACDKLTVSNTIFNATLRGGIKSGNFTDKGVVKHMNECSAYCCADAQCNVAFLIRDNCFLVSCKDYESCQIKPALSEYYHPRLAYVNWSPPDDEIPAHRWYASLGCWKDTETFAVTPLEGADPLLTEPYLTRKKPIDTCAQVARKHDFRVFAIQNGGACLSGPTAGRMFNQFGESSSCKAGKGGLFANDVYRLTDFGYISLGCWNDSGVHAIPVMEHSDKKLDDFYKSRLDPLRKCGEVARKRGYPVFALQRGGMCFGGPRAEIDYKTYGISRRCRDGLGGTYANSVYRLIDNLEVEPTESTNNFTSPSSATGSSTSSTATTGISSSTSSSDFTPTTFSGTQRSPTTWPSPTPEIQENYLTLQNGLPHKNTYTAGEILYNVTLKYGIKTGKFSDKGKVGNMSECVRACGRMETCSLAFMLGKQCFAVACYSDALCLTKPAFSPFYKPQIAFVKHTKEIVSANKSKPSEVSQCRASAAHNDVTLVGGINAGKFTDLGNADNMSICTQRCCMKNACDVAFMLENECYGVSCLNESLCESRPARNPARYNPRIVYVYHDKKKDNASPQPKSVCWDGEILYNYTLVGGINAGTFSDNGKTTNMDICMQFCCKRDSCDLAFMIEDDCYSVSCNSNGACEPRKARPTHYLPRIAIRKKPQGNYNVKGIFTDMTSTPLTATPLTSSVSQSSSPTPATSPSPTLSTISEVHQADSTANPIVKVAHSCDATPIEYNVTLKMGLHSGVFQKVGRVDSMDDCIEMSCKEPRSDVAFMLGSMCYAVHCYSADLCKTVPIFGSSISRLNLNPAISFLQKNSQFGVSSLATTNDNIAQDKCRDSTITYNVTLRGGIDAGNFTERPGVLSMRECIGKCCDDTSCDLAFMFGDHCYSVECQSEKLCQAVLAKPSHLEPKVSYVSRGFYDDKDKGTMFSANDQTPTCRADQKSQSEIFSNKTLVGGLEAGKFSFEGVVSDMHMCMDRCCAQQGCNVAYMVDNNCFSVACYSPSLCKISDTSSTNGDVEISTILESTAERPAEKHSMVLYVIIGVVGFAAGAGGILWAVCMFIRRHRLRSRHRQDTK
ncbi:Tolloid-like protein 1 [Stylophora pistillata]|uniref:Tolloid-like protein 1 n=1 Tax=Stylophora pistillata TaxID=50429 RepID=A0A2B4SYE8_STYPI|nr:Tolloid-like protein 1 [Stylophora pistillata]